jgi:VWFA-related protein
MNTNSKSSRSNLKFSLLIVAVVSVLPITAWTPSSPRAELKLPPPNFANLPVQQQPIQIRSTLVQVDALVTDANGNRIENLNLNNFQLTEDRHLQKLTAVDFYDIKKSPASQESKPINLSLTDSTDSEIQEAIGRDHRLIVLFFDISSFHPEAQGTRNSTLPLSITSAKKFVNEQITPADLVTIIAFDMEISVPANFTNNHVTLNQALDSLPPVTLNHCNDGSVNCSLIAAEALSKMLARFPGRKSIVHFTGGIPPKIGSEGDMEKATDAANKNNVSFYEIDGKGLQTVCGDASVGYSDAARRSCVNTPQFNGSRNGQDTLAHSTGGALFVDSNDFTPFFKQILDESTGYYLLSYESSNHQHDGLFRSISIKLVGVPNAKIKFRPGYFAPKD